MFKGKSAWLFKSSNLNQTNNYSQITNQIFNQLLKIIIQFKINKINQMNLLKTNHNKNK